MSLHTPFKGFPVRSAKPVASRTRTDRSPAASSRRQYGPFVTACKQITKLLFLGLVGLMLSVLMFAVLHQDSSVRLLGQIWAESWKPIVVLVMTMGMLAAIEESMS